MAADVTQCMGGVSGSSAPTWPVRAAATSPVMLDGRFFLGVGTGERLNQHIRNLARAAAPERRRRQLRLWE